MSPTAQQLLQKESTAEHEAGPRILTGIAKIAHHHIVEKSTNKIYSGISKVPGLHLLLQWVWRKTVEKYLAKVARPCQVVAGLLGRCVDAVDAAMSSRIIRVLQLALDTTNRLGIHGAGGVDHSGSFLSAIDQMHRIRQLNAQLEATESQLAAVKTENNSIQPERLEAIKAELKQESRRELHELRKTLKRINASNKDLEAETLDKANQIDHLNHQCGKLENELEKVHEQLVQVESYKRSSHGEQFERLETELSETKMRLVDCEAEKDDLEFYMVEMQEEIERLGLPPLETASQLPESCRTRGSMQRAA